MTTYYLAVDIGASSGRHILFWLDGGRLKMEEIYRFENGMKKKDGHLVWDVRHLFEEILTGMKHCREIGRIPVCMGIDTWAVDYVLLDESDQILGEVYGYRDARTDGMDREVYRLIPEQQLYERTGIQKQSFNTIYQLMADAKKRPKQLRAAKTFLMLPDYFAFRLTGVKASEYTNATSTQLVDPVTKQWDKELIEQLGFPSGIFLPLSRPGSPLGRLSAEMQSVVGFDCEVVQCATHDTASAVMAMPVCTDGGKETVSGRESARLPDGDETDSGEAKNGKSESAGGLYISSGTWSLMGVELPEPNCSEQSRSDNFTNEGGYAYRFRYLKNIMGLWMIQSVRHELGDTYSFAELAEMAQRENDFPSVVDANDPVFLAPAHMGDAVREYCRRTKQPVPETIGQLAAVIYKSLAACYGEVLKELERNTGRHYESIHIIGGGCKNQYLNQLTANAAGRVVYAGPSEATAIGNALAQMIYRGEFADLKQARACVGESFEIQKFTPVYQEKEASI
ncbi:MAG: rhamnulokinase [Lachnospiraceae bacterium]|nr:rhamnulokinase [Lachnospiraceae bacterium]